MSSRHTNVTLFQCALLLGCSFATSHTVPDIHQARTTTTMSSPLNEPNPPKWPESVKIFRETDDPSWIQKELTSTQDVWLEEADSFTCDEHFSTRRIAVLFAPGEYKDLEFEIGYYVQVAGLGISADDVKFIGKGPYVPALNKHLHKRTVHNKEGTAMVQEPVGTCLDSFWRSAENFSLKDQNLQWAVSQAAPLRRVHVEGDLYLHDGEAYASGGHLANAKIDGHVYAGGQQQYLVRNVELGAGISGGAWSMVYVGCSGDVPEEHAGSTTAAATTVISQPRVRIEKPYLAMKADHTTFELRVPKPLLKSDAEYTTDPILDGSHEESRDFSRVRVVGASDPVASIQEALDEGKDVVLAPGIFSLEKTIEIRHPGQVLLGLGLATLESPKDGTPCVHVASNVSGVRIAGIMLEATEKTELSTSTETKGYSMLEWGDEDVEDPGKVTDPGALLDVFVRVGGATTGDRTKIAVNTMMQINSGHVVGDNLWIWRADHALLRDGEKSNYENISPVFWQSEQNEFRAETGIVVTGDDVTMYGLAVEHANGNQTMWSGERGAVHFYQCEFPYGVYRDFNEKGFRGYVVSADVDEHEVFAPGIYSNFRNDEVYVSTAIEHPNKQGIRVVNPFTVKLDNQGGIDTIVNGSGPAAHDQGIPIRIS